MRTCYAKTIYVHFFAFFSFIGVDFSNADSTVGAFVSVQVNVDAKGNNIIGDAGNEPSMAINPTDPNNVVIAFRYFENTTIARTNAGVAHTLDGGVTWSIEVLDLQPPDAIRFDPVRSYSASHNLSPAYYR